MQERSIKLGVNEESLSDEIGQPENPVPGESPISQILNEEVRQEYLRRLASFQSHLNSGPEKRVDIHKQQLVYFIASMQIGVIFLRHALGEIDDKERDKILEGYLAHLDAGTRAWLHVDLTDSIKDDGKNTDIKPIEKKTRLNDIVAKALAIKPKNVTSLR